MRKLEIFFDYTSSFCLMGHKYLTDLLPQYPDIEAVWRPCESHPRPEQGKHSDLCIQGMFYALEQGIDSLVYHKRIFDAIFVERVDVEKPETLARGVRKLTDPNAFLEAINSGKYAKALQDANDYARKESGITVLPAFRMEGKALDASATAGITKQQIIDFLKE
jgi:predicted DsbA family dithiol-disulfide isomerase